MASSLPPTAPPDAAPHPASGSGPSDVTVDLTAVIISMGAAGPQTLVVRAAGEDADWLPSGPLRPEHRTLQTGLRAWVEQQTGLTLGYVEQLYTFGDRARTLTGSGLEHGRRALSLAYLALVRSAEPPTAPPGGAALWLPWYAFFPWEDWRDGEGQAQDALIEALQDWVARTPRGPLRTARKERLALAFGHDGAAGWDEERALERYELLYEARLVPEAFADAGVVSCDVAAPALWGRPMAADHRRILATAISRLRGKIKYRPVLFELMPPEFTLLQLQRTAEALSGVRLHKQNFRRLVEHQELVEDTGAVDLNTGGRPARLVRFRKAVTWERPAPGLRVKGRPVPGC